MSAQTTRQRVTLNDLKEPQQLRELNRQLEWVWTQLMGGLTRKSLSSGLNSVIESKASAEDVDELAESVEEQSTLIEQTAASVALKADRTVTDALGRRLDSAEAEIALVPDSIRLAVSGMTIGGANLVSDSASFHNADVAFEGASGVAQLMNSDAMASRRALVLGFGSVSNPCAVRWNPFTGLDGQTYTWSFSARYTGGELDVTAGHACGGTTTIRLTSGWQRYTHTWVYDAQAGVPSFFWQGNFAEGSMLSLADFKIESGEAATGWSSAPGELFAGTSVAITKDYFHVETNEFQIDAPGGETFHLDAEGGSMDNLTVNRRLIAPNVARKYDGASIIMVGPGGQYASLQEAFDALNDTVLTGDVALWLLDDFFENARLGGLSGQGSLAIHGNGYTLKGGLRVTGCGCLVSLENMVISGNGSESAVVLSADRHVRLTSVTVNGAAAYEGVSITDGASAELADCALYNAVSLISAGPNTRLCCVSLIGGDCGWALSASGAQWLWSGTRPDGDYEEIIACLHSPADFTALPVAPGNASVSQQTAGSVQTDRLTARLTGSCMNGSGWMSESALRQGRYDDTQYAGCLWFDLSGLAGRHVLSASLTLTRVSGAGGSSAVEVALYTTPLTGRSGNPHAGAVSRGSLGSIGNGETKSFALPAAAVQALVDGGAGGLMLYADDQSLRSGRRYSANYAKFDASPALTVTYQ